MRLLDARKTLDEHRRLLIVGGWLSLIAATLYIDLEQRAAANSWLATAASLAQQTGQTEIYAWRYETEAWQVLTDGDYHRAAELSQAAQQLAPRGSLAAIQATAQEGRAWARLGKAKETYDALNRVERFVSRMEKPETPEHHYRYDPDKAEAYVATTLAWLGDVAAEHHARHVVATLTHEAEAGRWPRRLASANIDLALALLLTDRLDEACVVAQASMLSGRLVASNHWRALEVVRTVEARGLPEAPDLREAYELMRRGTVTSDRYPARSAPARSRRPSARRAPQRRPPARCPVSLISGGHAVTMTRSSQPRRDVEAWLRAGPAHYGNGPTAVYCDFENLVLGAGSGPAGQTNPVPTKAVTWLCRWYGDASIRRAYADWADPRFGRHQAALHDNNIDLIHIPRLTKGAHKNAADIRLAVDAMETLMTHPEVGVFVLVTGDSDYTPLVGRLREYGKHVIGVGTQATASTHLVQACTEYKFWATIVAQVQPDAPPATQPGFRIADAEQLLIRAFEALGGDVATPTASQVKARMLALDPSFDEANYGCSAFRAFLAFLPHRVRTAGSSGSDITLALID